MGKYLCMKQNVHRYKEQLRALLDQSSGTAAAASFATGVFLAVLPTAGLGLLLGGVASVIMATFDMKAFAAAFAVFNPLVVAGTAALSVAVGGWVLGTGVVHTDLAVQELLVQYTAQFLVGNLIVAGTVAMISYAALRYTLPMFNKVRSR